MNLNVNVWKQKIREKGSEMITPDSEILRLEKRQRGLQRVATAINDLTIYGIYPTNFPKLVTAAEHFKDHIKAEISSTKEK